MKKNLAFSLLLIFYYTQAQSQSLIKPSRVIFYNVENLFDTINDPATQDEEFLPSSKNKWDTKKYRTKLNHTAKVFASILDTVQPLVIGMSEIENIKVLQDLLAQPALKKFNLGIVHHDSPDERGIDAALLYNKDIVESMFDATLNIDLGKDDKTRNILYFKASISEGADIWFFVNHWPSRRGGAEDSDDKRMIASKALKTKIDNIYLGDATAKIVVMGDFNDNPSDASLQNITAVADRKLKTQPLVNLMQPLKDRGEFTLRYKDQRDIFDQLIVSVNLLDPKNHYFVSHSSAAIFNPRWILYDHKTYGLIPNRTFANGRWLNGYSDHLPVYFDLEVN